MLDQVGDCGYTHFCKRWPTLAPASVDASSLTSYLGSSAQARVSKKKSFFWGNGLRLSRGPATRGCSDLLEKLWHRGITCSQKSSQRRQVRTQKLPNIVLSRISPTINQSSRFLKQSTIEPIEGLECDILFAMTQRPLDDRQVVDLSDPSAKKAVNDLTAFLNTASEPHDFDDAGRGILILKKDGYAERCAAVVDALQISYSVGVLVDQLWQALISSELSYESRV